LYVRHGSNPGLTYIGNQFESQKFTETLNHEIRLFASEIYIGPEFDMGYWHPVKDF